jgi:hypothetical protein
MLLILLMYSHCQKPVCCSEVKNQKFVETECTLSCEVLTALLLKIQPFWDAILRRWLVGWLFVPDVAQDYVFIFLDSLTLTVKAP